MIRILEKMTDDEWMAFRVHHLSLHNIYIPDCDRRLYDAPMESPGAPGGPKPEMTTKEPPRVLQAQGKALESTRNSVIKQKPIEPDLSEFIGEE
jgi:hypothetical protein